MLFFEAALELPIQLVFMGLNEFWLESGKYCSSANHLPAKIFLEVIAVVVNFKTLERAYILQYWLQPKMSTFSTRALILWYQKLACKYIIPILIVFKNTINQYTIYSLNGVLGNYSFIYYLWFCCKRLAHFGF